MRLRRMKGDAGSVAVLVAAAVPLLAATLLVLVDVGRLAFLRARLQVAADRAAVAGAAAIAHDLNRIAAANFRLHRAFSDLAADFASDTQQDERTARQRIERYEAAREAALEEVDEVAGRLPQRARSVADATLKANLPQAEAGYLLPGVPRLRDDVEESQWERLEYGSIEGPSFIDPESVASGGYRALSHLIKERSADAVIALAATAEVRPLLLDAWGGSSVRVLAASAGQAFGGAAEIFALKDAEELAEAEEQLDDEGSDALYRSALMPPWVGDQLAAGGIP